MEDDLGHFKLEYDIAALLEDTQKFLFHDYHKNGLVTPKIALVQRLEKMITNVKEGRYDN